jgi:prepilin signal peptidase PulO-like enzyme (type II secretory pathway)
MRCRACKQPISWQYPIVELALGLLYLFAVFFHGGVTDAFARDAFVIFFLAFTFLSDFIYQRIFFSATLVPAFIVFGFALAVSPVGWQTLAIGVAVGGGFFLLQHLISRGTWIGVGDIFFGIFMGVILGWPLIIVALVLAYIIGALVAIPLLISKKRKLQSKIPFGTFLSVATFVTMFWGGRMLDWYLGLVL